MYFIYTYYFQEKVGGNEKTNAHFKMGNYKKFSLYKILSKIGTKEES